MKKMLSLVLASVMALSLCVSAFAANTYNGSGENASTEVTYSGSVTESYTVTVPATLAPGASGDVTAVGNWASNRKLNVQPDATVTIRNSLNAAETRVLDITGGVIDLAGDNTQAITADTVGAKTQVSVANFSDQVKTPLFGTWSGTFNYTIGMADVA